MDEKSTMRMLIRANVQNVSFPNYQKVVSTGSQFT